MKRSKKREAKLCANLSLLMIFDAKLRFALFAFFCFVRSINFGQNQKAKAKQKARSETSLQIKSFFGFVAKLRFAL